jgi:hypothetical protein
MSCRAQCSGSRSLDVRDRADISLLAPKVVISNGPDNNQTKDQKSPVEVRHVGVRCDRKEHEDQEHGLESHGPAVMSSRSAGVSVMFRSIVITHVRLLNMPNFLPRLKRDGGNGSPERRRHTMHPIQIR